ncbi:MAG: preprotein translocase subunit YajC [Proteobacteria bacterium]|nr:preprotein translocase subunit YajC [Pseudomonadota bacterium]MDE3208747.1 preprotein translocase subunit YajC [Pseudomonadota bacterium]
MFINDAYAAAGSAGFDPESLLRNFLPLILLFALFYFLAIRPQLKRQKEHRALIEALQAGDEVATSGGVLGKVTKVSDDIISLEVAEKVVIKVQRASVQMVLPKGTIKD